MTEERELAVNADEAAYFKQLGWRADRWAISSESELALEVFSYFASGGTRTYADIVDDVVASRFEGYDALYLARLFRIVAVRPSLERQHSIALDALDYAVPKVPHISASIPLRTLYFELLFWNERFEDAARFLATDPDLPQLYHGYLEADLLNPYVRGEVHTSEPWLEKFNEVFRAHDLAPIVVSPDEGLPFDGLGAGDTPTDRGNGPAVHDEELSPDSLVVDGPLVTVVLTTFNPKPEELRTSVRSILDQTWRNIELLVVDDHSTEVTDDFFCELESLDSRLRIIRMPQNGGTYLARNAGIRAAMGEIVTGQDTDDWSHPQRIEKQLRAFHGRDDLAGVIAMANRTDERLVRTAVGFAPQRRCEVSLMFRREDAIDMGGYLPVRKGADSEFRERLMRHTSRGVEELSAPLYITRLSHGSLSRADFRHGWTAPHRLAFSSAYRSWHGQEGNRLEPLSEGQVQTSPFVAPRRISGVEAGPGVLDVCFVADWRANGELERSAVDEIAALLELDVSVGVLQLDSPFSVAISPRALNPMIQGWINEGTVRQVMLDEDLAVQMMIVRDPAVFDYARADRSALRVQRVLLVAAGRSHGSVDEWRTYEPRRSEAAALRLFGAHGRWILTDGGAAEEFGRRFETETVDVDYPLVVSERYFSRRRRAPVQDLLVVGRGNGQFASDWPDEEALRAAYLEPRKVDLRILGDAVGGLQLISQRRLPPTWTTFRNVEYSPIHFWRSVHAVFQFDRRAQRADYDRAIIEALAAGTPVLCSMRYAELFGGAVLAVDESEAVEKVHDLYKDPARMDDAIRRGIRFVQEKFSPDHYRAFIANQLAATPNGESTPW